MPHTSWTFLKAVTKMRREIDNIHWDRGGFCNECGGDFPCLTLRTIQANLRVPDREEHSNND